MVFSIWLPMAMDSVSEIPGNLLDVMTIEPSSSVGINSVPMNLSDASATITSARATIRIGLRCFSALASERP